MKARHVGFLPKKDLVHGVYYYGHCRNASKARWDAKRGVFVHWRTKFGAKFLETIHHPEDDNIFDVFYPLEVIDFGTDEIPFNEEHE